MNDRRVCDSENVALPGTAFLSWDCWKVPRALGKVESSRLDAAAKHKYTPRELNV